MIGLIAYGPSLNNAFVWDDEQFIYRNVYVEQFAVQKIFTTNTSAGAGELTNYYRPLTTLSFAIDHAIWGKNPFGFHLTNMLLHITAGLLLFYLCKLLKLPALAAASIATLFIVHPIQTEAVIYANSRGDSLYAVFLFLTLISFYKTLTAYSYTFNLYNLQLRFTPVFFATAAILNYAASILSKEIGIATGGLLFLLYIYHFVQQKLGLRDYFSRTKLGLATFCLLAVVGIGYLALRATVLNFDSSFNFYSDGSLYQSNLAVRLLTFTKVIWIYLRLLLIPFPLHMERDTSLVTSAINPWTVASLMLVVSLLVIGWKQLQRKNPWILFGLSWFFIMLLPVSGIIPINGILYEHWLYLPIVGWALCLYGLGKLIISKPVWKALLSKKVPQTMGTALVIIWSILTIRQNYIWGDPVRFYTYTLKHSQSARLHNNLAMAYSERGKYTQALEHYTIALEFFPYYPQIHHNMGNLYAEQQEYEKAEESYLTALEISPSFFFSVGKLFNLYVATDQLDKAYALAQEYESSPLGFQLYYTYGMQEISQNNYDTAEEIWLKLQTFPTSKEHATLLRQYEHKMKMLQK